ncbi:hypothetical protein KFK09_024995 [Dendrobium nobile]|uniref:Fungal lipase-type domain-containing protein n=1 Tax=Dendrobium nobile TaxID=94219 RepID=A0A8T3AFB2_DENNO|nr:hypothetical protein KFK09_024995 [Dendrobium nobile]
MEFLAYYNCWNDYQEDFTTQAFIMSDKTNSPADLIVVAFRGTEPFDATQWCRHRLLMVRNPPCRQDPRRLHQSLRHPKERRLAGKARRSLNNQKPYAYYVVREKLRDELRRNENARYVVTGHSLGGALAVLFPLVLALHGEDLLLERLEGVYTSGSRGLGTKSSESLQRSIWVMRRGGGDTAGSDYSEGWTLRLLRLFGLIVPGLPPHSPQDYVNCTRLGNYLPLDTD